MKENKEREDDIMYNHALTFSHEELAVRYSLCVETEQECLVEIVKLRKEMVKLKEFKTLIERYNKGIIGVMTLDARAEELLSDK